jgi:hypothetical protein
VIKFSVGIRFQIEDIKERLMRQTILMCGLLVGWFGGAGFSQGACPDAKSLIKPYLAVSEPLAADSLAPAVAAGKTLATEAKKILKDAGCKTVAEPFVEGGTKMAQVKDIAAAREVLKGWNGGVIELYTLVKPTDVDIVWCPMGKLHWLQKQGTVRNPYYGASMLECGLVVNKKVLQGKINK